MIGHIHTHNCPPNKTLNLNNLIHQIVNLIVHINHNLGPFIHVAYPLKHHYQFFEFRHLIDGNPGNDIIGVEDISL